jgi:hypothetical protein
MAGSETIIGTTITFQGATAKIKSLVAVMEQRLQKPIHVSRFCHLTGAEFCAPMTALFGHVDHLLSQGDYLFMPYYLEQKIPHTFWAGPTRFWPLP